MTDCSTLVKSEGEKLNLCRVHLVSKPTVDINQASHFLQALDPKASQFAFVAYDEKPPTSTETIFESLVNAADKLKALNKTGKAIAVLVNLSFDGRRKEEDITSVRAVHLDYDKDKQPSQKSFGEILRSFPVLPSMAVRTSPGNYHFYWLVEGDWPNDDAGLADFKALQAVLENYGHDPAAKGINRILRLPGFLHQKAEPTLVRYIRLRRQRYGRQELLRAFNVTRPTQVKQRVLVKEDSDKRTGSDRILSALAAIPADPYDVWVPVGMALHNHFDGSDEGFEVWNVWSQKAPSKYKEKDAIKKWKSFENKTHNKLTLNTFFRIAKTFGWTKSSQIDN